MSEHSKPQSADVSDLAARLSCLAGRIVAVIGAVVLAGWAFDIPTLKSIRPDWVTVKANTALCFVLCGTALCGFRVEASLRRRRAARGFAAFVVLLSLTTVIQYVTGEDFGIDQIIFTEPAPALGTPTPGRMSMETATSFLLIGVSLLLLDTAAISLSQIFSAIAFLIGFFALTGYVYGVSEMYDWAGYSPMAPLTAVTLLGLAAAVFHARPQIGIAAIFTNGTSGGVMARRLIPIALLLLPLLGWLRLSGEHAALYSKEYGVALFALATIAVFIAFVTWIAVVLRNLDEERERAAADDRRQRALSQAILETSHEAFIEIDSHGSVINLNPAAERTFGWTKNEMLGRDIADTIIPPKYHASHKKGLARFIETGEAQILGKRMELSALHHDGHEFPIEITVSSFKEDDEWRFHAFLHDITERERTEHVLRESEERFRAIFEKSWDAVMLLTRNGFFDCNPRTLEMFGFKSKEEFIRAHPADVSPPHQPDGQASFPAAMKRIETAYAQGNHFFEWMHRRTNGEDFPAEVLLSAFPLHGEQVLQATVRDITEKVRAMKERERANRELAEAMDLLEERVRERTADLERVNRDLETMLHIAAHDLKEPIYTIDRFTRSVAEETGHLLDEKANHRLLRVVRAAERMRHLLDDLIIVSQAERMEPRREEIPAGEIVEEALSGFGQQIDETGAQIRQAAQWPVLNIDRRWATEAVANLISNALKFTRPGEPPEIEIAPYDGAEGRGIVVRDRGPGIPPEMGDRLFQLFERGVGHDIEGTGAGLAIVRRIAMRHGGKAWGQLRIGGGSEFIVIFEQKVK